MHIPSAIYAWVLLAEIVGYEKVQSVVMINEGEELAYFWDGFSNFLPLMDKSGNRVKIKNY